MPSTSKASKAQRTYGKKAAPAEYSHGRSVTAYKYFDNDGMPRAGPHTSSHVFTKVNIEKLARNKDIKDYRVFLNSRIAPSPGRANAILKEGLSAKPGRLDDTQVGRTKFLKQYTKLYSQMENTSSRYKQVRLLAKIIELSPQQTYRWDEGHYSDAQIAGKGESRQGAEKDSVTLKKFSATLTYKNLTAQSSVSALDRWKGGGFKSIDHDATSQSETDLRRVIQRSTQLVKAAGAADNRWETLSSVSQKSDYDLGRFGRAAKR